MKLQTWLRKQGFDITAQVNDEGVLELWVNEKEDSAEPVVILYEVVQRDGSAWRIGNIYSTFKHGDLASEYSIRRAVKNNTFIKHWA
ncbi:hypothetical protein [Yersinia phage MHG19]|nr:hypothetical protein [Yersinia phage MHG19]